MDKLSAMKAFARVVEVGSFTKAANSLGLPKAQVSRMVQSLEAELKTLLLNRTTRRVVVTTEGAAYYDRASHLLDEIDELESNITRAKVHPRGKLRIDVSPPVANLILIPKLEEFCSRYPDIRIELGLGERPVDLIGETVDCVLRAGMVTDQSLVARRIADVRRVVCASPKYLERFGVPRRASDLEDGHHRVLSYLDRVTYALQKDDEQVEITPRSTIAVNDSTAMLAAAVAGLGIARTAAFMAMQHVSAGELQVLLPEWSAGTIPLYVVYPPNRHVSAKLRVFVDWAADLIGKTINHPGASGLLRNSAIPAVKPGRQASGAGPFRHHGCAARA